MIFDGTKQQQHVALCLCSSTKWFFKNEHDTVACGSVRTHYNILENIIIWKMIDLINKSINYSYVLKQETEWLIPAQTGNRTIEMYTSI